MTIEQLDRYNDFVKWGLTDCHSGLSETTAEEESFLKSIGAGEDEEKNDEDGQEQLRVALEIIDKHISGKENNEMSIFSDHNCGALSDDEFREECKRMDRRERYEQEHMYDEYDDDELDEEEEGQRQYDEFTGYAEYDSR